MYTEKVVEERLHTKSIQLKKDIASRLTHKSESMFLYIYRSQARLKSSMNASKLRAMIDDTPRGGDFDEAYENDLQAIASLEDDDEGERTVASPRWVVFAAKPLILREFTCASHNQRGPLAPESSKIFSLLNKRLP